MNPPKVDEYDYINFLIALQSNYSTVEMERVMAGAKNAPAHDAYTRLLKRLPVDTEKLWNEVKPLVNKSDGVLIVDDTTLDKPYANKMELVTYHWSGKHKKVVKGINLITLLWTNGDKSIPIDFRIYNRDKDGLTKNDHFLNMLNKAYERGFSPNYIIFDSWYASLKNLKTIRNHGWKWITRLKSIRKVSTHGDKRNRPISEVDIPDEGVEVHLRGYGWIKVFKIGDSKDSIKYFATNDLKMDKEKMDNYKGTGWKIEEYHRGLKQCTGIEKGHFRLGISQHNHIGLCIRAFVRLEYHRLKSKVSWFECKVGIVRDAIKRYIMNPIYELELSA